MAYARFDEETNPLNIGVFGAFVAAVAVGLVTTALWSGSLRRVSAAAGWPSVKGTVVASGVYPRGKNSPEADVIADVEYTVNGVKHESAAEEVMLDVPRGMSRPAPRSLIDVWYDPGDPSRCTLINAWQPRHSQRMAWIGIAWGVAGLTFPVLCYRLWRASQGELIVDD